MSKFNPITTDFTAGEISEKCIGRVDIARYAHAVQLMRNMFISPQGGAVRRSGTIFVQEVPDSTKFTRLIEFRFSSSDAVVLELSDNLIRFYKNQGIVLSGMSPYSVASTYSDTDLPLIKYTQSASIVYLLHPDFPPNSLARFSDTNWVLSNITFVDGPYLPLNYTDGITKAPAGTALTAVGDTPGFTGTITANNPIFVPTDVGRHLRFAGGGLSGWLIIDSYTSSTVVVATNQTSIAGVDGTQWNLGAFGETSGYPTCADFFQQRFVLGNTRTQPQTFFASQTSDFYNFGPSTFAGTVTDASSISYTIASKQVNDILWFSSSSTLLLGTSGGEWQVSSNSYGTTPITPTNCSCTSQTVTGSKLLTKSLRVGSETIFITRTGRDVYKMMYNFQLNGFQAQSLSLLGEHIPREGNTLVDAAYQQFPYSTLWFPRETDGKLAGITYLQEQDIVGWHLHDIGGGAVVESVAVIPTPEGTKDQLWMVCKRTINGVTKRYVEYMEVPFEGSDTAIEDSCFLDSAGFYDGSPATVISGLDHLAYATVSIFADGLSVADQIVSPTGTITLQVPASKVRVGFAYESTLKVLRFEGGGNSGTGQGKKKRVYKVVARFYETIGAEISPDGQIWEDVYFRDVDDPMNSPPPLFTGDVPIQLEQPVGYEGQYWFRQKAPYPMTILALMPETMVNQ